MSNHPIIGILGGMGPEATVDLMRRVIAQTPAEDDIDHIHLIIDQNPKVPSRIKALIDGTGESPLPTLCDMAQRLQTAGAQLLAMPCNTAHNYYQGIQQAISIPVLNMIELSARKVQSLSQGRVGLLASTAVVQLGLYEKALSRGGMETIIPERQADLMAVIKAVKRGDTGSTVRRQFCQIGQELAKNTDLLLIACTELSVLADSLDNTIPLLDAMDALVEHIVAFGLSGHHGVS